MKKNIILVIAAGISAIAFLAQAKGQGANKVAGTSNIETRIKSIQTIAWFTVPPEFPGSMDLSAVNVRAIKDFKERFIGAINEKWYSIPGGYLCYFQINGHGDRAFYDKKGHWLSSLKIYDEYQLPKNIRSLVRGNYFDYTITLVEEAQIPRDLVYFIHIEDKSKVKILRVTPDGDMQTIQEFVR